MVQICPLWWVSVGWESTLVQNPSRCSIISYCCYILLYVVWRIISSGRKRFQRMFSFSKEFSKDFTRNTGPNIKQVSENSDSTFMASSPPCDSPLCSLPCKLWRCRLLDELWVFIMVSRTPCWTCCLQQHILSLLCHWSTQNKASLSSPKVYLAWTWFNWI